MSSPVTRSNDPRLMRPDENAIADPHPIRPLLAKRTFSANTSPPVSKTPDPTGNDTLAAHTLTLQTNGSLLFEHVRHSNLSPYALDTSVYPDKAVSDRPLSNDQQEGIFNVRSSENDLIPGHQVESTRRYLLRWHSFPVLENWSKALTQPGYPPLKVIADSKPGTWTVEPNAVLFAMAESLYAYHGKPLAGVLDPKTQLISEGKESYVHIHGRNFPVEEHKIKPPLAIANSQQKGLANGAPRVARQPPIDGFFIKTPPGLSASDWPPLQIVRNNSSGEWTPLFSATHIATLLTLLAETGLYGFTKQKDSKVQNFQLGSHYAPVANNIVAKIGSISLPAVIHHGGRLPAVPVKWDPLHRRYYIYSAPQPAIAPSFTEREAWGIRLLMVGHMMRNPIQGATELIKGMQNDAQAQERLAAFIHSGQWPEDSSVSGLSAQLADMAFNVAFGIASDKGSVGVNVFSWAFTLLGKALLNQPVTREDAEEILAAGADIMDVGIDQVMHKAFKKVTVTAAKKSLVDNPLLRWAESKAVDEPHLQRDSHYPNLWRHSETGQLYVQQQQHFPRYMPVVKRAENSFVSDSYVHKKTQRYLTAGKDGQLHTMTSAQQSAWLNTHPTQLELQQRHYREIEVTARDGSKSTGYVAINNEVIKTVYRFVPESRSFTQSGQSVDAQGRVIGLLGGGPRKRPAMDKTGEPPEKRPARAPTEEDLIAWRDMSPADRKAAGGVTGYARAQGINPGSWGNLAKSDGLTAQGELRLTNTRAPTVDDLKAWRDMSQEQRDAVGGAIGYARTQGINPGSWGTLARSQGLTPQGESRLSKTRAPTQDDLKTWRDMSPAEREAAGSAASYANKHGINQSAWSRLVKSDGLTLSGESKLIETRPPTNDDLIAWRDMSQAERDAAGGTIGYASRHGINQGSWAQLAKNNGLAAQGESRLIETRAPSHEDLKAWRDMSPAERKTAGGAAGYARTQGINPGSWGNLARNDGLTPTGESRLTKTRAPTHDDLKAWRDMSQAERDAVGGTVGYATRHGINPGTWGSLTRNDGLTLKGESKLTKTRAPTNDDLIAWRDMSQAERDAAGGASSYAMKHGINPGTWSRLVKSDGLTLPGESKLTKTRTPTVDDLKAWRDMSQAERDAVGGTVGYATRHGINQGSWAQLAKNDGLAALGESRLTATRAPTHDDLKAWRDMTQEQRDTAGGAVSYATRHGINPGSWGALARNDGLPPQGESRLTTTRAPTQDDLKTWRDMSQPERDAAGGTVGYARKHGITPGSWVSLARNDGLTLKGKSKLTKTRAPTRDDLKTWRDMPQPERDAFGGSVGYATTHGINQGSWSSFVHNNGLSTRGLSKLDKTRAPTIDDLKAWRDMSQAERDAVGGTVGYATKHGINMNTWASRVNKNGLSPRGEQKLNSAQAEKTAVKTETDTPPHASGPVKMILLNDDGGEMEIYNPSPSRLDDLPATDNSLPILRDPHAFAHSLTLRAEGIKDASELNLFAWNGLFDGINKMSKKEIDNVKAQLIAEIRRQVSNETQLGAEISRRMVSRPSHREDDQGNIINLGSGIFNPEAGATVPKFTVLGPYAGVFYDSEAAINRATRRLGTERSLSHSWQTRSSQRIVDGWESGNELRNINTHRLGDAPAVAAEPNVAIVRVGKNLSFYVTSKNVKAGEEYFVDYGPGYNRHFAMDHAKKEEQMAQFWLDRRLEAESLGISLEHLAWRYYLDPKEVGRAVLQFRQQNSGGQALDDAARHWLDNHPLPANRAKTQEVAHLYLNHQAEAESWGITPTRMAEHYGVQEQALRKKIAHPPASKKQGKLSADADKWLEDNPLQEHAIKIKQEPANFAEDSPLAWLAANINQSGAWVDPSFEAMPRLIAGSNTLRQANAFLVITHQNNGISQIIDSRTGNIVEPQDAIYSGRRLVVIQQKGNHYDAWTNPQQNVTFLKPDSDHPYYRVNTADRGNQWQPIAASGYCMTEATAAALISRNRTQAVTTGDIQEYAHSLRNDIRERILTLGETERQQLEATIPRH